ncbi:beta-glucoside-specific PTS transporter subunit IIABC [Lacticaseibacillus rhamnosus]|uniref:beta-glucoside-specific PTS transporter subunit IIABC n=1 Tax=Lacticaseibacillus rhamnosus TaxID=47715 RepID=UPI0008A422EC|nr:beta-glucoside-specific PTS transporter subunit IIABC [Lacticaseibacillus rhamnosus]OFN13281.1 PTS beta-glucoside transporter subunit EIIBCA [Lactobacillus sp. HMSC072E07]MBS4971717.1 beta-glucoside-specific PTS transporter subunit IIABC [Lacticaseibacillus rhamnosus]MDE3297040.1 beta-glucoside-specific PTS transporter subunit IIABC [Lacticaseibacillus rhamnosus]MDK7182028.1 beta-glucoside-specific PTS transporter subunit IIABC [Lacticaseibacillus rhamnosus]MDK7239487.1 beta-glucoside-speci
MGETALAKQLLKLVGGKQNINQVWHCATRLRFTLKDQNKVPKEKVEALDGVITVVEASGQFQVVIGNNVSDVYQEVVKLEPSLSDGTEGPATVTHEKMTFKRAFNGLLTFISGVFTPFLGAMAGAGILKGLLSLAVVLGWLTTKSGAYQIWWAAADGIFYFLPLALAFTAAKQLKVNQFVAMAIAAAMVYPNIVALVGKPSIDFFGIPVVAANYTATVLPILLVVVVQKFLEPFFNRIWHESVRNILAPLCLLVVIVPLTMLVVGPVSSILSNGLATAIVSLNKSVPVLAGMILGGFWQVFVIFGVHWALVPVMMNNIALYGTDPMMPILLPAVLAQAGAAFAVFLKARDAKMKSLAGSSTITALFGITEPTIYGITLKLKKPFYCACVAGAVGGIIVAMSGAGANVASLASILSLPTYLGKGFGVSVIGDVVAFVLGVGLTLAFGGINAPAKNQAAAEVVADHAETLAAPVKGTLVALSDVPDEVFASGTMGQGIAIEPEENVVKSPVAGTVSLVYPTGHAIGITSDKGAEILIHIGIDTVNLKGKHFKALIEQGQKVTVGTPLVEFDYQAIQAAGYAPTVMMIVTNSDQYQVETRSDGATDDDALMTLA